MHELAHCATAVCEVAAETAFAFLADDRNLGSWALGCWNARPVGDRTVRGKSLFDGSQSIVRVTGVPERLTVDYAVGAGGDLQPRISVRVVPGPVVGRSPGQCLVTMLAWRSADMTDARWARLVASHEVEILLLKARVEEVRR